MYDGDGEIYVPELEPECEFRCDGMCHPSKWRCDGFFDCQDGLGKTKSELRLEPCALEFGLYFGKLLAGNDFLL